MSFPHDDPDMGRDHGLDDRLAEDLLRRRPDAFADEHRALAEALGAIRHAASAHPRPSEELQAVFSAGIPEDELAEAAPAAAPKRALPAVLARGGASLRGSVAKVAGLSLLVKLTLGGMAVAAAGVGGAGVAGVLPGQDRPSPAEEADVGQEIADEAVEEGGVDGQDVSERVREPRGDEPGFELPPDWRDGVTSRDDEAHDRADDAGEPGEDPSDHADERGERGLDEAEDRTGDTPAEDRTGNTPAAEQSDQAPSSGDDGREEAERRTEQRSDENRVDAPDGQEAGDEHSGSPRGSPTPERDPDAAPADAGEDGEAGAGDLRDTEAGDIGDAGVSDADAGIDDADTPGPRDGERDR